MKFLSRVAALLSIVAVSLFATQAAIASTCGGTDLLAKLKDEQPEVYRQIAEKAAETPNGEALLWRISGNGAAEPSYLFGTMHVTDERVAGLNSALLQVLDNVSTVALEIEGAGDVAKLQAAMGKRPDLLMMQDGSLWDLIDDSVEPIVAEKLAEVGMPKSAVAGLKPWLPALSLSVSLCEAQRTQAGHPVLDKAIETYARKHGKQVIGLETAIEQFSIMSSMPLETQAMFLTDAARMRDAAADLGETMISLYLQRRLTWFIPFTHTLSTRSAAQIEAEGNFMSALIDKRNVNMAERANALLQEGKTLIAVGALHLPGETGLVKLFRDQGYEVEPID